MQKIEFPLTGNLRSGDVLRTVYLDRDECTVRNMQSAEGRNLFEMALDDYEPGCTQELWNIEGYGAFIHRDWRDNIALPNLLIVEGLHPGTREFYLSTQDGSRTEILNDGRQIDILNKLLVSSHYQPMGLEEYGEWVEEYKLWNRPNALQQMSPSRGH